MPNEVWEQTKDGNNSEHTEHYCVLQVGMQGSVPDDIRQDIIAPLQKYPNAAEVCDFDVHVAIYGPLL